jgi:hypothetical protein
MVILDDVDQKIAQWQSKLAAASDNLMALYDHPTYKRIDSRTIPLTGSTEALVTPALQAMDELFAQMGQLTSIVEQAVNLRHGVGRFLRSEHSIIAIRSLLDGPSIKLPPVTTPLEKRGLLTAAEQAEAITPERLLTAMTQAFETAKSAVLAVGATWDRLDSLLGVWDLKLAALGSLAGNLDDDFRAKVKGAQDQVTSFRKVVVSDPLSATNLSDNIQRQLEALRSEMEGQAKVRLELGPRLDNARLAIDAILAGRVRADTAAAKCRSCIEDTSELRSSLNDTQLSELTNWLSSLEGCEKQRRWAALAKGLDRWEDMAREYAEAQQIAISTNEGLLETLAELRGRLSALNVKMKARGYEIRPSVMQSQQSASECLGRTKVPLSAAAKLVADFESKISAR